MIAFFLIGVLYAAFVITVIILSMVSMKKGVESGPGTGTYYFLLSCAVIYTIIGPIIGFQRYDAFGPDIPFAKRHVLSIILLVTTSSASFWLAKITHKTMNPLIRIILSVGMLQGIVLCGITTIHFIPFIPQGILYPTFGFELLSPLIAFFLLLRQFYFYNNVVLPMDDLLPYHKEMGFIPIPHKLFQLPIMPRLGLYAILTVGALIIKALLAYGAGQDIDSMIEAYTQSVGFTFSGSTF